MEEVCRAWRDALRSAEGEELWKSMALLRFPRIEGLIAAAAPTAAVPPYRILYRNQLSAETKQPVRKDTLDDFLFTVELLYEGRVRESWTGTLALFYVEHDYGSFGHDASFWEAGRIWKTQPMWFSEWDAAQESRIFTGDFAGEEATRVQLLPRLRLRAFVTRRWHTFQIYEAGIHVVDDSIHFDIADLPFESPLAPANYWTTQLRVLLEINGPGWVDGEGNVQWADDDPESGARPRRKKKRMRGSQKRMTGPRGSQLPMSWPAVSRLAFRGLDALRRAPQHGKGAPLAPGAQGMRTCVGRPLIQEIGHCACVGCPRRTRSCVLGVSSSACARADMAPPAIPTAEFIVIHS
eukprot:4107090-Prymnesium_polylepis.1